MKLDLYTKMLLTAIATCLLWNTMRDSFLVVHAQSGWQKVELVDFRGVSLAIGGIPIHIESGPTLPLAVRMDASTSSIPVELRTQFTPIPVELRNIGSLPVTVSGDVFAQVSGTVSTVNRPAEPKAQHSSQGNPKDTKEKK